MFPPIPATRHLHEGLRQTIIGLIDRRAGPSEVNRLVRLCHSLAESHLYARRSAAVLSRVHNLDRSDLAFDCIAELFRRSDDGGFPQLQAYFSSLSLDQLTEEELLVHVRRLVSSKVTQGIFRLLNEADPSLGKILRNIKLAIGSIHQFEEIERFGETFILPALCDPLHSLPFFSQEELETAILENSSGSEFIPDLLSRLSAYLRSQGERRRMVPLISIALAIRGASTARLRLPSETSAAHDASISYDAAAILQLTMRDLRERAEGLLAKKKITPDLLEIYLRVVEQGLRCRIVEMDGRDFTLYGALKGIVPTLTKERYRKVHRSRLEYLARLASQFAAHRLRNQR